MLIDRIRADQLAARKARDSVAAGLLTTLIGEATSVSEEEFEKARAAAEAARADDGEPLSVTVPITDEKVTATITKFLKNAKANRELMKTSFAAGDAVALAKVEREIELLGAYLPRQMTEAELRAAIDGFQQDNPGASIGAVMAFLKANHAGLYDGKLASQLAKG
jgi:uncharacterized protein YqeY